MSTTSYFRVLFAALSITAIHGRHSAQAVPLDPYAFPSLGVLNLTENTVLQTSEVWYLTTDVGIYPYAPNLPLTPPTYIGVVDPVSGAAVFTFDSITIQAGVEAFQIGDRPVVLLSRGPVTINGDISLAFSAAGSGAGFEGGENGGGGGGGFGGRGGNGGFSSPNPFDPSGDGGPEYGDLAATLVGGSRGGEGGVGNAFLGGAAGGQGGGALEIGAVGPIQIDGDIRAIGEGGAELAFAPGGGGGSGGAILMHSLTSITIGGSGLLDVHGGIGAAGFSNSEGGGGGGSGGRVYLQAPSVMIQGVVNRSGGAGGSGASQGMRGDDGDLTVSNVPEPAAVSLVGTAIIVALAARRRMSARRGAKGG